MLSISYTSVAKPWSLFGTKHVKRPINHMRPRVAEFTYQPDVIKSCATESEREISKLDHPSAPLVSPYKEIISRYILSCERSAASSVKYWKNW